MNLQVSSVSQIPIYEQIKLQIKEQVLSGALLSGMQMPSIRVLAKELKIGVITSKRAYDDLCAEGYLVSQAGKGIFVAAIDQAHAKKIHLEMVTEQLLELKTFAKSTGISKEDLFAVLTNLYEED